MFGTGALHLLATVQQTQSEGDWHSIPGFVATRLDLPTLGHIVGYVLAAAFVGVSVWLLRRVWHGRTDWIDAAGWATVAMLVAASSLLPWYVAWALPLAAVGTRPTPVPGRRWRSPAWCCSSRCWGTFPTVVCPFSRPPESARLRPD